MINFILAALATALLFSGLLALAHFTSRPEPIEIQTPREPEPCAVGELYVAEMSECVPEWALGR